MKSGQELLGKYSRTELLYQLLTLLLPAAAVVVVVAMTVAVVAQAVCYKDQLY
jgi:hypothetical protein